MFHWLLFSKIQVCWCYGCWYFGYISCAVRDLNHRSLLSIWAAYVWVARYRGRLEPTLFFLCCKLSRPFVYDTLSFRKGSSLSTHWGLFTLQVVEARGFKSSLTLITWASLVDQMLQVFVRHWLSLVLNVIYYIARDLLQGNLFLREVSRQYIVIVNALTLNYYILIAVVYDLCSHNTSDISSVLALWLRASNRSYSVFEKSFCVSQLVGDFVLLIYSGERAYLHWRNWHWFSLLVNLPQWAQLDVWRTWNLRSRFLISIPGLLLSSRQLTSRLWRKSLRCSKSCRLLLQAKKSKFADSVELLFLYDVVEAKILLWVVQRVAPVDVGVIVFKLKLFSCGKPLFSLELDHIQPLHGLFLSPVQIDRDVITYFKILSKCSVRNFVKLFVFQPLERVNAIHEL